MVRGFRNLGNNGIIASPVYGGSGERSEPIGGYATASFLMLMLTGGKGLSIMRTEDTK